MQTEALIKSAQAGEECKTAAVGKARKRKRRLMVGLGVGGAVVGTVLTGGVGGIIAGGVTGVIAGKGIGGKGVKNTKKKIAKKKMETIEAGDSNPA